MTEVFVAHVFYSGRVQGVGFRYTALQIAKEFEVAGRVANLLDGRVELEAEGVEAEVRAFIAAVRENLDGHIRKVDEKFLSRESRLSGFRIH